MICNQCGRQDSEGHRFCTFCSAPIMKTGASLDLPVDQSGAIVY